MGELLGRQLEEKCAVSAGISTNADLNVAELNYYALAATQHRGYAASGLVGLTHEGDFEVSRDKGLVRDVHTPAQRKRLAGSVAMGGNRYPTQGDDAHDQVITDEDLKFGLASNGNMPVLERVDEFLAGRHDTPPIERLNDVEKQAHVVAALVRDGLELPDAIETAIPLFSGAFSSVAMHGDMIVAFRDPNGLRPLSLAQIKDGSGHLVSSETCGFYHARAKQLGDIQPGERVILTKGNIERHQLLEPNPKLDIFEVVYFSRGDSLFFGQSVGNMRRRMGEELADQYPFHGDNYLVAPIPETAKPMAEGFAHKLGLEYRSDVLIKTNLGSDGRTFIQPVEAIDRTLDYTFSYTAESAKNRDLVFVDDSIVRSKTIRRAFELGKRAGARTISFVSGSSPIGWPDFSGIATAIQTDLIAARKTPEEIRAAYGLKFLGYLALDRMIRATGQPAEVFNLSSFNGDYPYDIGKDNRDALFDPVSMRFIENDTAYAGEF